MTQKSINMLRKHGCAYIIRVQQFLKPLLLQTGKNFLRRCGKKRKAYPLQAMQAQRGLGELRLLDFLTTALYGGSLSALRTGRLYPQGYSLYSFSLGAESIPGQWFGRKEICH